MKIFLSYPLDQNTPTYGNRDKFIIEPKSQISNGVGANTSSWTFTNNHLGTHMDTPNHFYNSGKKTLDYIAEDFCFDLICFIEKNQVSGDLFTLSEEELNQIPSLVPRNLMIHIGVGLSGTILVEKIKKL